MAMTEFRVQVVKIAKVGKHPNADTLDITSVSGNYPVVFKRGSFRPGDLAVHVPPDALVPTDRSEFSFLADKADSNGMYRVRATKLRGIPSFGLLVPVPRVPNSDEALSHGQDVGHLLGVQKFESETDKLTNAQGSMLSCPLGNMVPHYDIEGLRRYEQLFAAGENVWVTEKVHGANGRWVFHDGKLYCGSRTKWREHSVWNRMAEKHSLHRHLSNHPGLVLYGEVYGPGIQDLTYGLKEPEVVFFDAYDTNARRWFNTESFFEFCDRYGLPTVPVLHHGPFDLAQCYELAEGKTTLNGAKHVREGVVIKPFRERWDDVVGRVFLKLPGQGYLTRKEVK